MDYIGLELIDYPKIIDYLMDLSIVKVTTLIITIGETKERKLFWYKPIHTRHPTHMG